MAGKTHPSDWSHAAPLSKLLALVALLGVIGGVILTMHFSAAAARVVGPTLIARNAAGEILLANRDTAFLVDAAEASTLRVPVEALGLRGPIQSVSTDGKDWYLGDDATGMLYRCDVRVRKCAEALHSQGGERIFRRAHRVAFAADRIFVTDSEAHRLLTFDRDGRATGATRTAPLELCFPNGIVAQGDQLYVADTNNFRIARVAVSAPEHSATVLQTHLGAPISRANCNPGSAGFVKRGNPALNLAIDSANTVTRVARPPARPGRVWPASVLHASTGEWWLVQMDNHMRMGDIIRYDADGQPRGRIELPPDADPIELIEGRDGVLVTDAGLTRVHRVTLAGKLSGEWGPADLQAMLRHIDAGRRYARTLQYLSMAVIGAGLLAAILVVGLELRRQRAQGWSARGTLAPVTTTAKPLGHDPLWVPLDTEVLKRMQRTVWVLGVYTVVSVGFFAWLARDIRLDSQWGRIHAFFIGVSAAVILLVVAFGALGLGRARRRRLGVSREDVWFDPGSDSVIQSRWEDVRVGARNMLLGRHLVALIDNRGRYLYPQAEVESLLLSRLPATSFLGEWRLQFEALRRGNGALWVLVSMLGCYLVFMLLRWSNPQLTQQAGKLLLDLFR